MDNNMEVPRDSTDFLKDINKSQNNFDISSTINCFNDCNQKELNLNISEIINDLDLIKIPKYPYNGKSPYLIDEIYMIGYDKTYLKNHIKNQIDQKQNNTNKSQIVQNRLENDPNETFIVLDEKPMILNTMNSSNLEHTINNETLIDLIFPNTPKILRGKQAFVNSNIVFSINTPINHSITNYMYFAYITYETVYIAQKSYLCPYGICFLSNYPYFNNYQLLAQYILQMENQAMPKEFFIYHLLHLPSAINISYSLEHFPSSDKQHVKALLFRQLTGYPLIQYDFEELFAFLPLTLVIQIFILTFLEIDIVFFSEDLEILNIVMLCFYNLNYPLNHSTYFHHLVSVSYTTFMQNISPFVNKPFSTILGVNKSYNSNFDSIVKNRNCFVVDVDNKNLEYKYNDNQIQLESVKGNIELLTYLEKIFKEKNENLHLFEHIILELHRDLQILKVIEIRKKEVIPQYTPNFFRQIVDDSQNLKIKLIQQSFYHFILKVVIKSFSLHKYDLINETHIKITNHVIELDENNDFERLFYHKIVNSSKYCLYFDNFIQKQNIIDTDIIPLIFLDEFANKKYSPKIRNKLRFNQEFQVIDSYYHILKNVGIYINLQSYYDLMKSHLYLPSLLNLFQYKNSSRKELEDIALFNYTKYSLFINNLDNAQYLSLFPFNTVLGSNNYKTYVPEISKNKISKASQSEISKLQKYKNNLLINYSPIIYYYEVQEMIDKNKQVLKELSRNEKVISSFIFLFIISRHLNQDETQSYIDLIIILFEEASYLPNLRTLIVLLISSFVNTINKKLKENIDIINDYTCLYKIITLLRSKSIILDRNTIEKINNIQMIIQGIIPQMKKKIVLKEFDINSMPIKYTNLVKIPNMINNRGFKTDVYNEESLLIFAENVDHDGILWIDGLQETAENNKPHWSIFLQTQKINSVIYSPLKLYKFFAKMAKANIHKPKDFSLNDAFLIEHCCTLHFYLYSQKTRGHDFFSLKPGSCIEKLDMLMDQMIDYLYMILEFLHKEKS